MPHASSSQIALWAVRRTGDRTAELPGLDLSTLVLCARDDILTPAYFSEELARLIPNARLHLLPTGGHACSRTVTEEFNRVVLEFLTGAV